MDCVPQVLWLNPLHGHHVHHGPTMHGSACDILKSPRLGMQLQHTLGANMIVPTLLKVLRQLILPPRATFVHALLKLVEILEMQKDCLCAVNCDLLTTGVDSVSCG